MVMQRDPLEVLQRTGALLVGHFVLTSGRHAKEYVNKDALYPHTAETSVLCKKIADLAEVGTQVIAAPAIGGVVLSQWVAHHLQDMQGSEVLAVYAEPGPDDTLIFKRGYDQLIPERKVLVVEDVLTTGGSAKKVVDAVRLLGGQVTGVGVLCNRGGVTVADLGNVPWLHALTAIPMLSWNVPGGEICPLCEQGVPVNTEVGKGKEFLARKALSV